MRRKSFKRSTAIASWYCRNNKRRWIIESCLLFVVSGVAAFFSYSNEEKAVFAVDYYVHHRMWPQVLRAARRCPTNFFVIHAANQALYHTGRLGYDLLRWPQNFSTLFMISEGASSIYWKRFQAVLDLGSINSAEHLLVNSMENLGERPQILKQLALVNMVKADTASARVYLGALSKTLFCADWAKNYLTKLENDPNLSTDERIQHLRSVAMDKKHDSTTFETEYLLLALLDTNRHNRMAFEYLMAWYLLNGQPEKVVQNLHRLDDFDYTRIPRLYEEAILVYVAKTQKELDMRGRRFSPESLQRFRGFVQIFNRYEANNQAAINELAGDYGDSLFFYLAYGFTAKTK
jgi:hypothetical protein